MEALPLYLQILLLGACLLLSAFFSSSEAAFLSLQRVRLQHLVSSQVAGALQVADLAGRRDRLLSTVLLGNNLFNTAAATLGTVIAIDMLQDTEQGVLAATVGVTLLLLIFGETVPKTIATTHPERLALLFWRPLRWAEWLMTPVGGVLQNLSRATQKLVGGTGSQEVVSEEDIKLLITVGRETGAVEHSEAEMLEKVFKFGDRQVREVMTSRTEIVPVEKGTPLGEFLQVYAQHTHTRFPVYEEDMDNVVGILSVKDAVRSLVQDVLQPEDDVTSMIREAYFIPETKLISHLLTELQHAGHQMAVVIDEYGGTAGVVTLKRLVEEVVGRGVEEDASLEEEVSAIDEYTSKVDASIRIDEANEKLGLNIPEGDYETLAGYILSVLGHIPEEGEQLTHHGFQLVVSDVSRVRIEAVTVIGRPPGGQE